MGTSSATKGEPPIQLEEQANHREHRNEATTEAKKLHDHLKRLVCDLLTGTSQPIMKIRCFQRRGDPECPLYAKLEVSYSWKDGG